MNQGPGTPLFGTIRTDINFWPSYVDIFTIVLMVLVLQSFLQTFISEEHLEIAKLRQAQQDLQRALESEFSDEVRNQTVSFIPSPTMLQVRFSEKILFRTGEYGLESVGEEVIGRCAAVLRQPGIAPYDQVEVEGHTDNVPLDSPTYPHNNWELSSARALTVVQHMIAAGVDSKRISANGYAEFNPAAGNETDEGRQQNRRIELRILFAKPKIKEKAAVP